MSASDRTVTELWVQGGVDLLQLHAKGIILPEKLPDWRAKYWVHQATDNEPGMMLRMALIFRLRTAAILKVDLMIGSVGQLRV